MEFKPYDYQKHAIEQLKKLPQAGAFLDMGLGKTAITLTAIQDMLETNTVKRILVIAPKRVADNVWTDEIRKWDHLNNLSYTVIKGLEKQRKILLVEKTSIHIIGRDLVVWLVAMLGTKWPYDMIVIDELSSFKSHTSERFKALKKVRRFSKRVVGLTGTPAPNGLLDLWAQLFLIDCGQRLGPTFSLYRETYFSVIGVGHTAKYKLRKGDDVMGKEYYAQEIHERIGDICFSMKSEDYLQLPEYIVNDRYIKMELEMLKKYENFEREQVMSLLSSLNGDEKQITALNAAGMTTKLMQFSNGQIYDEDKNTHLVHTLKMEVLEELLDELQDKNALLFYSFKSDCEVILAKFKYARKLVTTQDIDDWNAGKIKLLVAHPASAGHGLNLQFGGNNIIWYGCNWSLELYQQANKRIHRNGVTGTVVCTRILLKDTIDVDIVESLDSKDKVQNKVIEAVKARIAKYDKLFVK